MKRKKKNEATVNRSVLENHGGITVERLWVVGCKGSDRVGSCDIWGSRAGSSRTDKMNAKMNLPVDTGASSLSDDRDSSPVGAMNEPARESSSLPELAASARGRPLVVVMVLSTIYRNSLTWQLPGICHGSADYPKECDESIFNFYGRYGIEHRVIKATLITTQTLLSSGSQTIGRDPL
ncbi:hypothetical protein T10_7355, partial [Trichinella papuae]